MHPASPAGSPDASVSEPLPLPPDLFGVAEPLAPEPMRRGHLSPAWRGVTVAAWAGVAVGFGAVWRTSWTMGLSTWWLGPEASPRIVLLLLLPFVAPIVVVTAALRRLPWVPYWGIAASLVCALIGLGDVNRVPGLAAVELGLAGGALLVSVGSLSGLPRPVRRVEGRAEQAERIGGR